MRTLFVGLTCATALSAAVGLATAAPAPAEDAATPAFFERSVRPVLEKKCFSCHSQAVHLSNLRLDSRAALLKGGKLGAAVVPGHPERGQLLPALRYEGKLKMPPAGKLPEAEIDALTRWIRAGAPWPERVQGVKPAAGKPAAAGKPGAPAVSSLWAFTPVRRPAVPAVRGTRMPVRNPIDAFVLRELERRKLRPSPPADRRTLIRRVSFDLTGLPPTPADVDRFVADRSPDAYEKVVDRLLASPAYGERMALYWLDLARYADSDGYHDDTDRQMWRYRDYVIDSFNRDKPFDQFTVEQLAGDQLPNATLEQKIASAFNRCGPTSSEGGAIPEEYLAKYAVDRVNTTASVWLGLTLQCAECHDHKYDPLTTKDYYQLFAFFNQVPEQALYRGNDAPPTLLIPTPEQQKKLDELGRTIAELQEEAKPRSGVADPKAEEKRVAEVTKRLEAVKGERTSVERAARLRVMEDVPKRRPTHILLRGDYRSHGEEVKPGVPAALGTIPAGERPNRVALAKWIVDPKNPLTARVTVNRLWQMVWGNGLIRSSDDFGTRGETPTHPELLDWLASWFMEPGTASKQYGSMGVGEYGSRSSPKAQRPTPNASNGAAWSQKKLLRLIVTSAAYQQSSVVTKELLARDPENRALARGPRFRLPAEMIRDNALAVSGLLDRERAPGGPSVKPYQPGDLWRELSANDQEAKSYVQDHGPDLYRRGLYTWWKRSVLYPAFAVFDAPKREVCVIRRPITNTPLQAFATLNDVTYVEAARVFAQRILKHGGVNLETRLAYATRNALGRLPSARERQVLSRIYETTRAKYQGDPKAALALASAGEAPRPADLDPVEHAAWTCVCNALLNLDETLTKE